jgi:multidrug efflux pump subunit AcrA (membrane-fusion protein)
MRGRINMKVLRTLLAILLTGVVLATLVGCSSKKTSTTSSSQQYTVKKGDISLTITAAGNLALSKTEDLPVDIFYSSGTKATIGSVLVEEGDSVKAGQVLVTLDKDEWNDQLTTLQKTLSTSQRTVITKSTLVTDAERQLTTLQRAVTTAENNVIKAQRTVTLKQLAVTQAELSVQSANNTLGQIAVVKKAQDTVDNAEYALKFAKNVLAGELGGGITSDLAYWYQVKALIEAQLVQANADLHALLTDNSLSVTTDVALLIQQKVLAVDQAKLALGDAQIAVVDAETAVDTAQIAVDDANYAVSKQKISLANAKLDLDDANNTLADTQKKLTDAQSKSPEIKAPFDGFVTKINVSGGDEVLNGTVAVTVADPNKFEADILVSEMDIMKIAIGGAATISLNAMTGLKLPAKITRIAPTATISSGVVNYAVRVEVDEQVASRLQTAGATSSGSANSTGQQSGAPGGFSARAGITPPAGFTPPSGIQSSGSSSSRATSQLPSTVTQNFQLKQGLTGAVDLVVSQKSNVLLVPNTAVTKTGTQRTVQVVKTDGTTETRTVEIGLADWQNTEITSGLNEGEKVQVTKNTAAARTTTSSQQGGPGGAFFLGR